MPKKGGTTPKRKRVAPRQKAILVTCEHASCQVPGALAATFAPFVHCLLSHRGFDIGAFALARQLAAATQSPLIWGRWTRLMVDLNRGIRHSKLFSEVMAQVPHPVRQRVLAEHYWPHQQAVLAQIEPWIAQGQQVVHIGVHSFTPLWQGMTRRVDVGLLFDPARPEEAALCRRWQQALVARCPRWRIRRNNPYRGTADGLTTRMRRRLPAHAYVGIEVEMNQAMASLGPQAFRQCRTHIVAAFQQACSART